MNATKKSDGQSLPFTAKSDGQSLPFTAKAGGSLGSLAKKTGIYLALTVCACLIFFPILFSILLSLSHNGDIINGNYIPQAFQFENYVRAFETQPLIHYIKNSAIAASLLTLLQIGTALLSAYAIVFLDFRGKKHIFFLFMATMMIPSEVLIITNFQTIRAWGLLDTFPGLILPSLASTFGIFLLRQNLKQIPFELKDAAQVGGVGDFYFFRRVVIPMAKNSIVTLGIYSFLVSWNSYMWPLLSTTNNTVRTVQIGLRQLKVVEGGEDYGMITAGAMIVTLPTLLLLFLGQSRLREGLTKGAMK